MAAATHPGVSFMATFLSRRGPLASVILLGAVLLGGCTGKSYKTYDDYNPNIDFSNYQTFAFISDSPMIVSSAQGAVSPLLQPRLMNAIRADLSRKGFRYVNDPEQADMAISFTVGSRDQIKVDQYPASYRTAYGSYYGGYGYGYGMNYATETRVRQYTEGQLAIDIFDVRSKTPAFHGTASTRISSSDRENIEAFLNEIVVETLDGFPPGGAAHAQPNLVPLQPAPSP
jgi:hypothetical protein